MKCHSCKQNSVISLPNSEISLCKKHFNLYFEKKVRKTIRIYRMVGKNDNVGVAVSGGKDSMTLLYLLNKIFKPTKVKLTALAIDEGIKEYRDPNFKFVKDFCKKYGINLMTYSFKKEVGKTLDEIKKKDSETIPCTYCGVFRRNILNKKALELKLDKIATGHNLDDEAQAILMNQFRKNVRASVTMGPITGIEDDEKFVKRIKPLYFLTEKEVATFAFLNGIMDKFVECPNAVLGYRNAIRDWLNEFEKKYPGTKYNVVASFLSILPIVKEGYKRSENRKRIRYCIRCGSATSKEICQSCLLIERLGIKGH